MRGSSWADRRILKKEVKRNGKLYSTSWTLRAGTTGATATSRCVYSAGPKPMIRRSDWESLVWGEVRMPWRIPI